MKNFKRQVVVDFVMRIDRFVNMLSGDKYEYSTNSSYMDYEFESIGPNGVIKKVARFTEIGQNIYNFGFGDLNEQTGDISDTVVSNNGDGDKILITVAGIIYDFTGVYDGVAVFIKGTTPSRTRKYQMGIARHWTEIQRFFDIWGLKGTDWDDFKPGEHYDAFLGRRKAPFLF